MIERWKKVKLEMGDSELIAVSTNLSRHASIRKLLRETMLANRDDPNGFTNP